MGILLDSQCPYAAFPCARFHSFSASSIFFCHPGPCILKNSNPSADNRNVVCTFFGRF
jgi:hypothetical protein